MSAAPSILIVEDSQTQALALSALLQGEGYAVRTSPSAEAALEQLNEAVPDLVVADFHLPGMDGREFSRRIRLNRRTRTVPLLMLTSAGEQDLERQGLESGADAYVSKAADKELMLVRLRALLRRADGGPAPAADDAFRRARILVVHDSLTQRLALRGLLEDDGAEVIEAADAAAAVAAVERSTVDCVVLPGHGLGLDGLTLCRDLDAHRRRLAEHFEILLLSAGAEEPHRLAALFEAGADDVVAKEVVGEALPMRVRALLRRRLLADESRRAQKAEARAAAADALESANRQLREAQAQLVQSAKLASLGELVAGIAHEINNPLAFILGHQTTVERAVREARAATDDDAAPAAALDKALARLDASRVGLQRIQSLVLNLRKFSRLDEGEHLRLDAPDAIETVLALLKPKLGEIEVRRRFEAKDSLFGSPALLNQVVMNIVANAADALEGHGVIEIATTRAQGDYLITIDDSGPGVPAQLRDRIFEPFFTTKPVGDGTGLGLAIAYSVVQAHQGDIVVSESPLGGARFTLRIPQETAA